MEANPIPALIAALSAVGLDRLALYAPLIVACAAVLAAILPQAQTSSPWAPMRKLLDLLAMNVGAARNAPPSSSSPSTPTAIQNLFVLGVFSLSLTACSASSLTTNNAQLTADIQAANTVAVQDARLFCAVVTPTGPLVVAVADAAGAPVVATGAAKAVVDTACAAANGIPVVPPAVGSPVVTVAAPIPPASPI